MGEGGWGEGWWRLLLFFKCVVCSVRVGQGLMAVAERQ